MKKSLLIALALAPQAHAMTEWSGNDPVYVAELFARKMYDRAVMVGGPKIIKTDVVWDGIANTDVECSSKYFDYAYSQMLVNYPNYDIKYHDSAPYNSAVTMRSQFHELYLTVSCDIQTYTIQIKTRVI